MARRGQGVPISQNGLLVQEYTRRLQILGDVGELAASDVVVPVVLLNDLDGSSLPVSANPSAVFRAGNMVSGRTVSAGAGVVLGTTGDLAAGVYDVSWALAVQLATNVSWAIVVRLLDDVNALRERIDFITPATGVAGSGAGHRVQGNIALNIPLNWEVDIQVDPTNAPTVGSISWFRLGWELRA